MQPVGWGYPPPAAPPTTAPGATRAGATPQPPPHVPRRRGRLLQSRLYSCMHAAVQPGLQQPSTTLWSMQPQVLAVRTTVSVARATLLLCVLAVSLCALRTCSCACFVLFSADAVGAADPVLANSASVARAAVPVTSCLTAAVSHAVPLLGRPPWAPQCPAVFQWAKCSKCSSAHCRCSSSSKCSSSKCRLRPSKSAAQNSSSSSNSSRSNQDSSNPKCKRSFSLPHPGQVRVSPSAATSGTECGPTKKAPSAPKGPTGHG